jgi:tRNA(fMet)-specific endonuclease VapC
VKPCLIDTNILSLFFKGHPQVAQKFADYERLYQQVNFSLITYYEVVSGLKHRDAQGQLARFLAFANRNVIVPLTLEVIDIATDSYADLRRRGQPVDDIDLLIAATAVAGDFVLVTQNSKHFERIAGLSVVDWSA